MMSEDEVPANGPGEASGTVSKGNPWTAKFYPREGVGLGFDRLINFSDAVFAIALTLIAVEIGIPEITGDVTDPAALWEVLAEVAPRVGAFVVAFIWVAIYWRANHRFSMTLKGINGPFTNVTLLYLGFVALLPVPAALLGEYWSNPLAVSLFAIFAGIVSLIEVVLWRIADVGGLFISPPTPAFRKQQILGSLTPVLSFALSIPIAFLVSPSAALIFWLVGATVFGLVVYKAFPALAPD